MKTLFVHDTVFVTNNGKVYSNALPYTVLKGYVDIFTEVTVLARAKEAEEVGMLPLASGDGVTFVFLESISTLRSFFGLRERHKKCIKNLITEYDTVIARVPSELGLLAAGVARENKVKCLVEVVGCAWSVMWYYGGWKSRIYAPFFFMKTKSSIKKSVYTSYVTEQFLQRRYPSSSHAKTIGVSDVVLPAVYEKTLSDRIKKIEGLEEKIIFATIGSMNVNYKGIDIAMKVLSKIAGKYLDFEYHILGEGDLEKYQILADQLGIGKKVFFDRTLPRGKAVFAWLDKADIYLQPSLAEGLPRSLIEAMSRGCPVVGSSVGGIPELLDKEMMFECAHPEQLSEKIETLMNDKQLMIETATQNFHKAKQYQKSLLNEKRNKFWIDFRDD